MEMANGKENLIISPIPELVRTPDLERIRNARKRREIQLKEWEQYDRRMQRENEKMLKKGISTDRGGQLNVKFPPSLIFLEASARGDLDEVQKLLSAGVCPDEPNEDGLTALHQCCIDNAPEMCMLLLRFGANVNSRDSELWTPLHAAATCHHTELCRILIAYGADLLAINADGNMPYECCMLGPTLNLIELAMEKQGITQEQLDDVHRQPQCDMLTDMEDLCKEGADFNVMDEQGAAFLHIAAACGFEEVVRFLVKHGAKIDMLDRDGWQAIHIASCWDHFEVVEVLVNYGADIMATTKQGETVFDICEDYEVHKRLLRIKEDYERKRIEKQETMDLSEKPKDFVRRRSSTNPRSASVRRSSMKDKKLLSLKEAKQEAEMRVAVTLDRSDGDIDMDKKIDNQLTITHSMQQGHTHANSPHFNHVALNDSKTLEEFRNDNRSVVDGLINSPKPRTSHTPTTIPSTPAYPTKSNNGLSSPSVKTQGKNHKINLAEIDMPTQMKPSLSNPSKSPRVSKRRQNPQPTGEDHAAKPPINISNGGSSQSPKTGSKMSGSPELQHKLHQHTARPGTQRSEHAYGTQIDTPNEGSAHTSRIESRKVKSLDRHPDMHQQTARTDNHLNEHDNKPHVTFSNGGSLRIPKTGSKRIKSPEVRHEYPQHTAKPAADFDKEHRKPPVIPPRVGTLQGTGTGSRQYKNPEGPRKGHQHPSMLDGDIQQRRPSGSGHGAPPSAVVRVKKTSVTNESLGSFELVPNSPTMRPKRTQGNVMEQGPSRPQTHDTRLRSTFGLAWLQRKIRMSVRRNNPTLLDTPGNGAESERPVIHIKEDRRRLCEHPPQEPPSKIIYPKRLQPQTTQTPDDVRPGDDVQQKYCCSM